VNLAQCTLQVEKFEVLTHSIRQSLHHLGNEATYHLLHNAAIGSRGYSGYGAVTGHYPATIFFSRCLFFLNLRVMNLQPSGEDSQSTAHPKAPFCPLKALNQPAAVVEPFGCYHTGAVAEGYFVDFAVAILDLAGA